LFGNVVVIPSLYVSKPVQFPSDMVQYWLLVSFFSNLKSITDFVWSVCINSTVYTAYFVDENLLPVS